MFCHTKPAAYSCSYTVGIVNADNVILDLELSALQSDGHGEIAKWRKAQSKKAI